jgi:hypothetical protein
MNHFREAPDLHNERRQRLSALRAKAEKKGRTKAEVDEVIRWLTGYSQKALEARLTQRTDFETFFSEAPRLNPSRALIKGVICGVRLEDIKEPTDAGDSLSGQADRRAGKGQGDGEDPACAAAMSSNML